MPLTIGLLCDTLATVLDRVERDGGFRYRLIGTAAGLLRGVPLLPADVDLLVAERRHVDAFARALDAYPCLTAPIWMPSAAQYYAAFTVDGVKVEASTVERPSAPACLETIGSGPWTHFSQITVGSHRVPVVALELRLATELRRGRQDQVEVLVRWMQEHGCDLQLLANALAAQKIDAETQSAIATALSGPSPYPLRADRSS